jgi:hypothetical protein
MSDTQGSWEPNWYPHPTTGRQTWWDGTAWGAEATPPPPAPPAPPRVGNGLGVAAFAVGLPTLILSCIPYFVVVMWLGALVAIGLGIAGLVVKNKPRTLAALGLAAGVLAIILGVVITASVASSVVHNASDDEPQSIATGGPRASETPTPTTPAAPAVPAEFTSALTQATSYSRNLHLSKAGIFDQLTSQYGGQFTNEAAQYAIDNVQADWNANALAQAKSYQTNLALSPAAIREQLISQYGGQFLPAEADYAIQHLND